MKIFKRILYVIAALAMIGAALALFDLRLHDDPNAREFSNSDSGQSMFLNQVDSGFDVQKDGSLLVTEVLTYDLGSSTWHGLYQDFILANGEQVKGVEVYRDDFGFREKLNPGSGIKLGVGGALGSYGYGVIRDPDRRLRVVWNVNDTGIHRFEIRYLLGGAAKNYKDASSLLWDVWGTGWETGVAKMNVSVAFPGKIKLFYPRAGDLQRRIAGKRVKGNVGRFTVSDLPQKRQVQVQVAAKPLTGMPKENANILPRLKAEQAAIDARNASLAKRSKELLHQSIALFLILPAIGALIALLIVALCAMTFGRDETKTIPAGGSYQYPPEKIPPPVIAKALGGVETKNLVSSTLLGFLQRDVFRVLPSVEKKEDVSIRNAVGQTTFDESKVESWEKPIAQLLQSAIDKHPEHSPDFTKLKKYLDAEDAESKISSYEKKLKEQFKQYDLKSTYRGRVRRWLIGIFGLLIYALGLVLIIATDGGNAAARYDDMKWGLYLVGFGPVLLWAAVEGNAFYRYKADQADRIRKWETYQDFFAQMDMSREYPLTVEIWDEALLYAAAFGYAKKVITNMPRTDASGTPVTTTDTAGVGWMAGNAWAVGSFGNMTSGISGVTGMASSSSSGGGGFSGGGSGGGGGGGW